MTCSHAHTWRLRRKVQPVDLRKGCSDDPELKRLSICKWVGNITMNSRKTNDYVSMFRELLMNGYEVTEYNELEFVV